MRDSAIYLWVWLVGLFGIIFIVMAALTRMVRKDTAEYDKRFTWQTYPYWEEFAGRSRKGHEESKEQ
ncbi:hypothetical protein [Cohnella panacarvi]|uniref:hypothetical protein n=1 Tax=Cohnella panacarvi TaxID=400776 RepID=UPI0004798012|nr:hypothetical protein [Cohnella panacarvi]